MELLCLRLWWICVRCYVRPQWKTKRFSIYYSKMWDRMSCITHQEFDLNVDESFIVAPLRSLSPIKNHELCGMIHEVRMHNSNVRVDVPFLWTPLLWLNHSQRFHKIYFHALEWITSQFIISLNVRINISFRTLNVLEQKQILIWTYYKID